MGFISGRDRYRRPGRRQAFRDPKPTMLIVCEGKNTEPQYFKEFAKSNRNPRVKVEIAPEHGVPLTIVKAARDRKQEAAKSSRRENDENIKFDSVWCVFDVDQHPHVPEARILAAQHGIEIAVSNPCFELWLLLHLRDCPGMKHRHDMQAMLKLEVPNYDKSIEFDVYYNGYDQAVQRARQLEKLAVAVGEPGRNPTTTVHYLTESIVLREVDEDSSAGGNT